MRVPPRTWCSAVGSGAPISRHRASMSAADAKVAFLRQPPRPSQGAADGGLRPIAENIDRQYPEIPPTRARQIVVARFAKKRAAEAALTEALTSRLLCCTNLEDSPRAWELNQRPIQRIDKTSRAAGSAAGVPHGAVIDDVGALVGPEPQIGRTVKPGRIGRADKRLVAGVVAGKVLEADLQWQIRVLVEVDQLDFMPDFGSGSGRIRRRKPEIGHEVKLINFNQDSNLPLQI